MPKSMRERGYDIPFVGATKIPTKRDVAKSASVQRVLGRTPSEEFMIAFEVAIATFNAYRAAVSKSSAAAVSARIETVVKSARALMRDLERLELVDETLIGRCETHRFLGDEPYVGTQRLLQELDLFLPVVEEAHSIVAKEPKKGRMPAYAERALAETLGQILFEETNQMPTQTPNGQFGRLIRLAFKHAGIPERDVGKLLGPAVRHISKDISMLGTFGRRTRPESPAA